MTSAPNGPLAIVLGVLGPVADSGAFGAICPVKGRGAGRVMPWCDSQAMQAHLAEISAMVEPCAHAALILDQANGYMSTKLAVPDNITLLSLPPRSPELNRVENIWQLMRDNWLRDGISPRRAFTQLRRPQSHFGRPPPQRSQG